MFALGLSLPAPVERRVPASISEHARTDLQQAVTSLTSARAARRATPASRQGLWSVLATAG
jgi:hypothetical protein